MILYVHSLIDFEQNVAYQLVTTLAHLPYPVGWPEPNATDKHVVKEVELDSHEALKGLWNPATQQDRQAVIDALPKIQVISTAGMIQ